MSSFAQKFNQQKEETGSAKAPKFKFTEGLNKIRILAEPEIFQEDYTLGTCYHDCRFSGKTKYLSWVLDHSDNKIKQIRIPYIIMNDIVSLMSSKGTGYDFAEFPMPYSVTIKAVNAGTKEVQYTVIPDRENTPVPQTILDELAKKKTPAQVVEMFKKWTEEKHRQDGTWDRLHGKSNDESFDTIEYPADDINPNDIPF